ncbi:lipopolysaccharide biosynthesis protein, partial [Bacteroides ovatus]
IGSFGVKGITILNSLIMVPVTIDYISSELYGVWLTLTSIINWIAFFDIGFGNGLRNKLAEALAIQDFKKAKAYISTTYFYTFCIFSVIAVIGYFLTSYINWADLLCVSSFLNSRLIDVVRIVIICFAIQMVLKTQTTILYALQKSALANFIDAVGQVLSLVGILLLSKFTFPSLNSLAWVVCCCPLLVLFLYTLYVYVYKYKNIAPSFSSIKTVYAKDILSLGGNFFIIQIACLVLYQTTNIIIARVSGSESVTEYNVVFKYLNVATMVFSIIMIPIWSAFTDAFVKEDYMWMRSIYRRLLRLFYLSLGMLCFMVISYPLVFRLWLGDKVGVHLEMVLIVATFMVVTMWNTIHSQIINGIGKIRLQLYLSLMATFLNIPLAFFLGSIWGAEGVVMSIVIYSILPAIFLNIQVRKLLYQTAKGIWIK